MKSDENKEITNIIYNPFLNKPVEIQLTGGRWVKMTYDGSGALIKREFSTGEYWEYTHGMIFKNGVFYSIGIPEGRATFEGGQWKYEFFYQDHLGNTRVTFAEDGDRLVKKDATDFDGTGVQLKTGVSNIFENRHLYQDKESLTLFGLENINDFSARYLDRTINRLWGVDAASESFYGLSPYNHALNNGLRYIDPDGNAPLDVFKQGKDGRYTKVSNQGGNNFHTYINNNGTTSYYNVREGTMQTVSHKAMQAKLEQYRVEKKERISNTLKVLDVVDKVGDGLSIVGTVAAPFTEGASLAITLIGEGISTAAKLGKHSIKFSTEGASNENLVDAGVDIAFQLLPPQVEAAVKKSGLDEVSKKIIVAEIKQGTMATQKMVEGTIQKSRKKDEQ